MPVAMMPGSLADLNILVVEDDGDNRDLLAFVLAQAGADVRCAGSVAEALALAEREMPRLLITDLTLPDGDGVDILRTLVAGGRSVIAIALTGWARASDRKRTHDAGFAAHVDKPVDVFALVSMVTGLAVEARTRGA